LLAFFIYAYVRAVHTLYTVLKHFEGVRRTKVDSEYNVLGLSVGVLIAVILGFARKKADKRDWQIYIGIAGVIILIIILNSLGIKTD